MEREGNGRHTADKCAFIYLSMTLGLIADSDDIVRHQSADLQQFQQDIEKEEEEIEIEIEKEEEIDGERERLMAFALTRAIVPARSHMHVMHARSLSFWKRIFGSKEEKAEIRKKVLFSSPLSLRLLSRLCPHPWRNYCQHSRMRRIEMGFWQRHAVV
jgi:hypothetical protein